MPSRFIAALDIFIVVLPTVARAVEEPIVQEISETQSAAILMQAGRLEDAKAVLSHAIELNNEDNEAYFLLGLIAVSEMEYDIAIQHFRFILTREPDAERVRLELARAFFLAEDFDNAARNFRFARAGDLPPEAVSNVDQYLGAISRLKRWSYNFSVAIAQDTNVNAATDLNEVDIFGLPFVLSDDARKKSGHGISIGAGGEWTPLLFGNVKARLGGNFYRTEYGGGDFDDMTVSFHAGPEILFSRWQVALLSTGFQRWFGNAEYNNGAGGRIIVSHAILPSLQIGQASTPRLSHTKLVRTKAGLYILLACARVTQSPPRARCSLPAGSAREMRRRKHSPAQPIGSAPDTTAIYPEAFHSMSNQTSPGSAITAHSLVSKQIAVTRSSQFEQNF